jgi:N-formylglutamate amidohydrolase
MNRSGAVAGIKSVSTRVLTTGLFLAGILTLASCGNDSLPLPILTPSPTPGPTAPTPAPSPPAGGIDPAPFLVVDTGSLPIVLSAPHGGTLAIPGVPERTRGSTLLDTNTYELARATQSQLAARTGRKAFLVAALASRKYIDFNRAPDEAYQSPELAPVYEAYQSALQGALSAATALAGQRALLLVDIHGQSDNVHVVFRGTRNGQTAVLSPLYFRPDGLLARLMVLGARVDPSTEAGIENPDYNGGYIVARHGSRSGGVQAVQLEFGLAYRQSSSAWADTAAKLADALVTTVNCAMCR